MKRRQLLGLGLSAAAGGIFIARPHTLGGPHNTYFSALNEMLRKKGPGRPVMLVDLDRLRANVKKIHTALPAGKSLRIVEKSLPALGLMREVAAIMKTERLMVFHQPHLNAMATDWPKADILLGKPMPVTAAATFYRVLGKTTFQPNQQLQWLIDTPQRLLEYQQLAQQLGTRMRINIEIDIGLHRGGVPGAQDLRPILDIIAADPTHLEFFGFMGYDAHVGKIPAIIETRDESFAKACESYRAFQTALRETHAELWKPDLSFNGAGSPTIRLHGDPHSPLNEVSAGSCFVKPTHFDLDLLADLQPAAFIATPVLKAFPGTDIPGLGRANRLLSAWNPNLERTYFIYGGLWMAEYESPPGLIDNPLYGTSSNQAIVNSSTRVPLEVDDYIFLRPTQSEMVMLEFGDIAVVQGGQLVDWWPVLPT